MMKVHKMKVHKIKVHKMKVHKKTMILKMKKNTINKIV